MFVFQATQGSYTMGKPPLARAVVQLVFPFSAHLVAPQGLADLQDRLQGFTLQTENAAAFQISIGPAAPTAQRYLFVDRAGHELAITGANVTLSINESYKSRDVFQAVLESVLGPIGEVGKITSYERLGVRYINAAPATIEEFLLWFRSEFTGWAGGNLVTPDTLRTWVLVTQMNQSDPQSLVNAATIRYGFLPNGVGADITSSPAASQQSFLADIDMASFRQAPFSASDIGAVYQRINHEIAALLRSSLSDEGVKHFELRPKEDQAQ
jgi:uncharacterized protein (TIGR04255 family)